MTQTRSLFDEMIEGNMLGAGQPRQTDAQVTDAAILTDTKKAVKMFGDKIPFRGQLINVSDVGNGELQRKAGLDWKVQTYNAGAIVAGGEPIYAMGYQALVRDDKNEVLSITSTKFQPHQNDELLRELKAMADIGSAHICYAGPIDGGRKIVAVARMEGEFALPNKHQATYRNAHSGEPDDRTFLFAIISGGHEVGTPYKVRGMAFRQWCANGSFFSAKSSSVYTRTHRQSLDDRTVRDQIVDCFASIRGEFQRYSLSAGKLLETPMMRDQARLYVAELLKPGLAEELGRRLTGNSISDGQVWAEVAQNLRGRQLLNTMLLENEKSDGFARSGKQLLDAILLEQDGRNGDNLWSGYNGVTWHVTHQRGRTAESGVDAALFGAGALLTERALETANRFAQVS